MFRMFSVLLHITTVPHPKLTKLQLSTRFQKFQHGQERCRKDCSKRLDKKTSQNLRVSFLFISNMFSWCFMHVGAELRCIFSKRRSDWLRARWRPRFVQSSSKFFGVSELAFWFGNEVWEDVRKLWKIQPETKPGTLLHLCAVQHNHAVGTVPPP